MISKVTVCPFAETDHLAKCADTGKEELEKKILEIQAAISKTHPDILPQITLIDDLYLAAITAAQNSTLRCVVCAKCDKTECSHPTP